MKILRFFAREGDHSFSPPAARVGRMLPIGKTRKEDGTWSIDAAPATVSLAGDHEHGDASFLRGEVLEGRLVAADEETAAALETTFDAKLLPAPEAAAAPAPVEPETKAVDALPEPAPAEPAPPTSPELSADATETKTALSKRKEK